MCVCFISWPLPFNLGEAGEENPQAVGQATEEVGTEGNPCWYGYSQERISGSERNYYWTGTSSM